MFTEPVVHVDKELQQYHDEEVATAKQLIEDSGTTREVMARTSSQNYWKMDITVIKKSPNTGKMIPAFGKNDKAYQQLQDMYPEHKNLWDARTAVKSRISETRAKRFIDSVHNDGTISVPLKYYQAHTGSSLVSKRLTCRTTRGSVLRTVLSPHQIN